MNIQTFDKTGSVLQRNA